MSDKVLVLGGDGIGPEVTDQALRVLDWFIENKGLDVVVEKKLFGGCAIDAFGTPFPEDTKKAAKTAKAILLGAVGGEKWDNVDRAIRPETGLLAIRKELGLYTNLRPAIVFPALASASSLKNEIVENLDIMILRELTGGIYFGQPRAIESDKAYNTLIYHKHEVERIARSAFEIARKRGKKVCSVDKANVLESSEFWRNTVIEIHEKEFSDVELTHMYVDNAAMQLIRCPKQFDVIVTQNLFGDILSDEAAMLTGSLGMLPSASVGGDVALYEPVHGSAPDITGLSIANPIATILSLAMMFQYSFNRLEDAQNINNAISTTLDEGYRSKDIYNDGDKLVSTIEMTDIILSKLR